jgi:hypothetical protein
VPLSQAASPRTNQMQRPGPLEVKEELEAPSSLAPHFSSVHSSTVVDCAVSRRCYTGAQGQANLRPLDADLVLYCCHPFKKVKLAGRKLIFQVQSSSSSQEQNPIKLLIHTQGGAYRAKKVYESWKWFAPSVGMSLVICTCICTRWRHACGWEQSLRLFAAGCMLQDQADRHSATRKGWFGSPEI